MRKIVFAINVTADGYCDHTLFRPDDEVLRYFTKLTREAGVHLYGRKTFELMIPYWPEVAKDGTGESEAENEFASAFVSVPEVVVFSRTLKNSPSANTRILRGNLLESLQEMKSGDEGSLLVGGVHLASEILKLGLIDEFHLIVHPIFAGSGRRLFEAAALSENRSLTLIGTKPFESGTLALHYVKN